MTIREFTTYQECLDTLHAEMANVEPDAKRRPFHFVLEMGYGSNDSGVPQEEGTVLVMLIMNAQATVLFAPDHDIIQFLPPGIGGFASLAEARHIYVYETSEELGEIFAKHQPKGEVSPNLQLLNDMYEMESPFIPNPE